jgi:peptidoglycan/LPS O-acetylase OafA/YrhL
MLDGSMGIDVTAGSSDEAVRRGPRSKNRRLSASSSHAPLSRLGYRPELDGLRAIAIIVVVSIHYTNLPRGGLLGVDMFFTLSGFLITTLLLEEWQAEGSVSLRNFYLRRYFRLFPGLAALITAYTLYVVFLGRANIGLRLQGAGYAITYTSNWVMALNRPYPEWEIGHLWSLAVEEQFYIVWPIVLVFLTRRRLGVKGIAWALGGMILGVAAWRLFLYMSGADGSRLYFGTDTRFDQLLVGCLAGALFVSRRPGRRASRIATIGTAAGAAFVVVSLLVGTRWSTQWEGGLTLFAIAVAAIIYGCVTGAFPLLTKALSARWLVFIGVISYSIYLWHVAGGLAIQRFTDFHGPVLILTKVAFSLALACVSYFVIERPFVKRRKAYQRLRSTKIDAEMGNEEPRPRRASALIRPLEGHSEPPGSA